MIKYAITGNIASGKTAVENFLKQNGYEVLDTDKLAHEIIDNEVFEDIKNEFGSDILTDNKIDRSKLGKIVFNDSEKRKILEKIVHPIVKDKILEYFESQKDEKTIFVAVPLLFESEMENLFDKIILVVADDEIRLERLIKRNNLSRNDALRRIKSQMSQFAKFEKSDFVFHNNGELNNLKNQINDFCDKILKEQS